MSHANVEENEQMNNCIILYIRSTLNSFSNPNIVDNIKEVDDEMQLETNTGVKTNNQNAEVSQYGYVWHY